MKFNTVQNACCSILLCVRDGKWIYNDKKSDVLLFYIALHDPNIYLIWSCYMYV